LCGSPPNLVVLQSLLLALQPLLGFEQLRGNLANRFSDIVFTIKQSSVHVANHGLKI
jgi:hypothetical protein